MLTPEAVLNPVQKSTNTAPSLLEPKAPLVSLLASPPPSPSRNSIFNQSWSSSSGPNVSSLRPRSDSATSASSTSSFTDQHSRSSPRFGATDANEGSYRAKFYHHGNNSSQSNLRNKHVTALQEGTNTLSSSNGPSENIRDKTTPIRLTSAQRAIVRGSTLSPTPQDLSPSRIMTPVRIPRPLSLPSPSVSPYKSLHSSMPLSPMEHLWPQQENVFLKCRNILSSCEVVIDRSKAGLLGHGRHAEVYKALVHLPAQEHSKIVSLQSVTCRDLFETSHGIACAAKCLLSDPQSVEAGRAEDDILNRLQRHSDHHLGRQFVVDYIGLYDTSTNDIEYRPGLDRSNSTLSEDLQKCLLLEYCAGGTIWDWIRLHPEQVGLQQWLVWARQLLLAVDYIHEAGLIHHDIKPHNILLTADLDAKLSDFGGGVFLPKSLEHPALGIAEGLGRGTQPYSAPELFASASSNSTYGQGVDIYSLGVSLYVIGLTAQEPFHKMKSMLEMVVWIKKGGFWLWEDQSWVHDRGPVPKDLESNRRSTSSLSRSHSLRHANSGGSLDKAVSRSNSFRLSKQGNVDVPGLPLAPINTRLAVEERHLSVNSGSPERTFKASQPCTPVSPLPLPSPVIGPLTPRSPGLMDDRRASGETVMRFLNGEIVPSNIVQLLKEMCHSDPQRRPDAKHILKVLDEIEMEHLREHAD
ncbi:hypothetical protein BG006_009893 [Podila minutissima]|uniref:Protein kinase domain-containing protein n=1 Tax=Podila minutissima TaxID=64525 RepID=A0A9P5SHP6_9FUNG|nr:hypothetical protein BG006_009893 [Podila minutissima]